MELVGITKKQQSFCQISTDLKESFIHQIPIGKQAKVFIAIHDKLLFSILVASPIFRGQFVLSKLSHLSNTQLLMILACYFYSISIEKFEKKIEMFKKKLKFSKKY